MIPLARKLALQDQARAVVAARRAGSAVGRTGQVPRSSVSVGDDEVALDDVLTGAVDEVAAGEGRDSDLAFLDDSDIESFDTVVDAGSAGDIDMVLDAQDADPDLIDEFDADADADEDAHQAGMDALEAAQNVKEAIADAAAAAQAAANAQTTADGKNARRRGVTEPAPPEGGWVQGDQWVRDVLDENDDPVPVEVLVWNGTEFVHETTLTGELLVIGENGVIRLADGSVTANAVSAEFYYGREFHGGLFSGGLFRVAVAESVAASIPPPETAGQVAGAWYASGTTALTWDSAEKAIQLQSTGTNTVALFSHQTFPSYSDGAVVEVTCKVKATQLVAGGGEAYVRVNTWSDQSYTGLRYTLLDQEWLEVSAQIPIPAGVTVGRVTVSAGQLSASGTKRFLVKDLAVRVVQFTGDSLTIGRNRSGVPELRFGGSSPIVLSPAGISFGTAVDFDGTAEFNAGAAFHGPATFSDGVTSAAPAVFSDAVTFEAETAFQTEVTFGGPVEFEDAVAFAGDLPWTPLTPSGATGTLEYCISNGVCHFRGLLSKSSTLAADATWPVVTLPDGARPKQRTPLRAAVTTSLDSSGVVQESGLYTIVNTSGAGRTNFQFEGSWRID